MPLEILAVTIHTLMGEVINKTVMDENCGQSSFNMNLATRCEKNNWAKKKKTELKK